MIIKKIRGKIAQILSSPRTFFVGAFLILTLLFIPLSRNLKERFSINREINELEQQILKTKNKNLDLQKLIGYLDSDQYVEGQARENLGMMKPGEQVIVVKGLPKKPETESNEKKINNAVFIVPGLEKAEAMEEVSNFDRWLKYFFKNKN